MFSYIQGWIVASKSLLRAAYPKLGGLRARFYLSWRPVTRISIVHAVLLAVVALITIHMQVYAGIQPPPSPLLTRDVFLPMIVSSQVFAAEVSPVCHLSPEEQAIFDMARSDPDQQRATMYCNPTLAKVARARAEDMANNNYFGHVDSDGFGPDYLVQQAGYVLPDYYGTGKDVNYIESIAAGQADAASAWQGWMNSEHHRPHLLGLLSFTAAQTEVGVGFAKAPGSTYIYYWSFISAPPQPGQ